MVNDRLLDFIKKEFKKEVSEHHVRMYLLEKGWVSEDIDEAFNAHRARFPREARFVTMRKFFFSEVPSWVALSVVGLVVCATGSFFITGKENVYSYTLVASTLGETTKPAELTYGAVPLLSDPDFFNRTRTDFINQKAHFIEANLETMQLSIYKEGVVVQTVPIKAKGKQGAWWQTPTGLYKIETKEATHFSSFGHVSMPWSMQFQGNFFIHGWPHYPDGTPVATSYSGGCIRLSDDDAKIVYELARVGMPVLVFEKDADLTESHFTQKGPDVSAPSYLLADVENNFVFSTAHASTTMPVASITKLITALVVTEYINLDQVVTIRPAMLVQTSKSRLFVGQKVSTFQLLYLLLEESSNEAAEAFAQHIGRAKFISLMNAKAKALGLSHTTLVDPAGSEAGNVSTPEDLFTLAKYLYNNRSFILNMTANKLTSNAYGGPQFKGLGNFNLFSDRADFLGGKIGKSTAAKETMLALFRISIGGEERPVALILLGSNEIKGDVEKARQYVANNFK